MEGGKYKIKKGKSTKQKKIAKSGSEDQVEKKNARGR